MSQARTATDHYINILAAPTILFCLNRTLNFKNIKIEDFYVSDWNYTAYCKVRDSRRSVVQIHSPRPILSITYPCLLVFRLQRCSRFCRRTLAEARFGCCTRWSSGCGLSLGFVLSLHTAPDFAAKQPPSAVDLCF